ncbi:hypothetical protein M438DRAFT_410186 [Aureobasidium pullulans EXF-150]|uniref:Uncharacterized protein n=1 Tax=Aureobasidium pullulans EXF-150 TaxID=1043002 RepID=A0A074X8Y0_AURPU|nr:uncharacterized protein M438DRAFT_410186 [Aureobasidium pullulans EXF-150]KEQ78522.1 hypothetical protein M438DRAFT_410186 [Aureobasidium pullulans EXF-150]
MVQYRSEGSTKAFRYPWTISRDSVPPHGYSVRCSGTCGPVGMMNRASVQRSGTVPLSQWFAVPHNQTNRAAVNSRTFTKAQSSSIDFDRCGPERRRNDGGKAQARIIDAVFPPQIGYQEDRIRCSQLVFIDCTCGANPVCWRDTIIQALYWITYRGSWRQLSCNCHDILNMQPDFRSIGPFGADTLLRELVGQVLTVRRRIGYIGLQCGVHDRCMCAYFTSPLLRREYPPSSPTCHRIEKKESMDEVLNLVSAESRTALVKREKKAKTNMSSLDVDDNHHWV